MQSVRALTTGLIDYAGLFPPAQLGMSESARSYEGYTQLPQAFMLGRFVLPASRLEELSALLNDFPANTPWKLAVLLGDDFEAGLREIAGFSSQPKAVVEAVEMRSTDSAAVRSLGRILPKGISAFIEVSDESSELLDTIHASGFAAKIRTGGIEQGAFPKADGIVGFLRHCRERKLAFKATAGLHHLVCGSYPLTYEPGAKTGSMFGFLNVFAAAIYMHAGANDSDAKAILSETDPQTFVFSENGLSWRDRQISVQEITRARREFALSFGSCSFTEPVEELERLLALNSTRLT